MYCELGVCIYHLNDFFIYIYRITRCQAVANVDSLNSEKSDSLTITAITDRCCKYDFFFEACYKNGTIYPTF